MSCASNASVMKCLCCGQDGHALADCQNRGFYFDRKVAAREKARKEGEWAARQAARTKKQEEWDALQETRSNSTVSTADTASSHHAEVHRLVDSDKEVMQIAKNMVRHSTTCKSRSLQQCKPSRTDSWM